MPAGIRVVLLVLLVLHHLKVNIRFDEFNYHNPLQECLIKGHKGNSVRERKCSWTVNDLQIGTQMIPTKNMEWHRLFRGRWKKLKKRISHKKSNFYYFKRNIPLFEGHWLRKTLLQCVYWNRGHSNNENQSDGRIETIDSNVFKSSQSNVLYKTMKS